jgi:hypothetical protein
MVHMDCLTPARRGVCLLLFGVCAAAPPSVMAQSVGAASGKALCSALAPSDFTKVGIPVSGLSEANLDGKDGAYCVYQSKAGKVEFDIFFPAGANPREIRETEKTVLSEGGAKHEPTAVPGAEDAQLSLSMPDLNGSAAIVVLKGKAVFDIVIPKSGTARQQLIDLAQVVLLRLKQ